MIWETSDMMSNLIDAFRDLGWRLHSHLAAATTMFPFLTAPGRCVPIASEIPRFDRNRMEFDQSVGSTFPAYRTEAPATHPYSSARLQD